MKKDRSELVDAAEGLEEELARFEGIAAETLKVGLDSQKALERAGQTLKNVVAAQERVDERVSALVAAIGRARGRHHQRAQAVEARALEIEARGKAYGALMEDFAAIGTGAGGLNQKLVAAREAATPDERRAALAEAGADVADLANRAKELAARATEQGFQDVSRQAEGLRQQLLSGLNRIKLSVEGAEPRGDAKEDKGDN